jgi:predicted DCC family thiol-disulfide oxidoreductase YuxK
VLVLPNQLPDLLERYGLNRSQVDQEVWAIEPDGTRWSGAGAINRILQVLGGLGAWVAAVYELPPIRWIEDRAYRWIAGRRTWLSRWISAPPEWKG